MREPQLGRCVVASTRSTASPPTASTRPLDQPAGCQRSELAHLDGWPSALPQWACSFANPTRSLQEAVSVVGRTKSEKPARGLCPATRRTGFSRHCARPVLPLQLDHPPKRQRTPSQNTGFLAPRRRMDVMEGFFVADDSSVTGGLRTRGFPLTKLSEFRTDHVHHPRNHRSIIHETQT